MRIKVDIGNKNQPEHFHKVILVDEKSTLSEIQKAHQLALEDAKRFYEDYNKQKITTTTFRTCKLGISVLAYLLCRSQLLIAL